MPCMLVSNSGYLKIIQMRNCTLMWKTHTHVVTSPLILDQLHCLIMAVYLLQRWIQNLHFEDDLSSLEKQKYKHNSPIYLYKGEKWKLKFIQSQAKLIFYISLAYKIINNYFKNIMGVFNLRILSSLIKNIFHHWSWMTTHIVFYL